MELADKLYMKMEVCMKVNSKMKTSMDMADRYLKMENIILDSLKMIKGKVSECSSLKVDVFNKVIGKMINF
jgi:hypothetical protein